MVPPRGRRFPRAAVLCAIAMALAGCADVPESTALSEASTDLACPTSRLSIEEIQIKDEGTRVYRVWGCGHEAAYTCSLVHRRNYDSWHCARSA